MKKKIYFIIYSIVQCIVGIYSFINLDKLADSTLKEMESILGTEMASSEMFAEMFSLESIKASCALSSGVLIVLSIIFLILACRNSVFKKKGLAIGLIIGSFFCSITTLSTYLAIATLVVVIASKSEKNSKEKSKESKGIKKLRELKVTGKDLLLAGILMAIYLFFQFTPLPAKLGDVATFIIIILFHVGIFIGVFAVFRKRFKRDFEAFKENKGSYIAYIFKMWGLMFLLSFVAVIIVSILGGDGMSENQAALNEMPLLYVIPLACIWAPIVEEGIFRGVLRRFIPNNDKLFIAVSAITFGLLHTVGQEVGIFNTILYALQYMAMGGALAYTYVKSNNICTNIGVHFVQNTFSSIFMILMSLV